MRVFERSWQKRLIRGRDLLPRIRDQGAGATCSFHSIVGAVESATKKAFAEIGQGFEYEVSVDYLTLKFKHLRNPPLIKDTLEDVLREGIPTVDGHQIVKIEDFRCLEPQQFLSDFVDLMTHVLAHGTAIGVFRITSSYNDKTVYYEASEPLISDSDDGAHDEHEYYYEDLEGPFFVDEDRDGDEFEYEDEDEDEDEREGKEEEEKVEDKDEDEDEDSRHGDDEYHAVLIISLGMDKSKNLFWRVLDSHGPDVGENGTRRIAVNLMKEAYIIEAKA